MKNLLLAIPLATLTALASPGPHKGANIVPIVILNQADPGSEEVTKAICNQFIEPMAKDLGYTTQRAYALPTKKTADQIRKELRSLPSSNTFFLVVDMRLAPIDRALSYGGWVHIYASPPNVDKHGAFHFDPANKINSVAIPFRTEPFADASFGLLLTSLEGTLKVLGFTGEKLRDALSGFLMKSAGVGV